MGGFKQGAFVTDVCTRGDTDTANLRCQGVRNVVTVQVHTGDNIIFSRTQQDLLQECISNHVFNDDLFAGVRVFNFQPRAAVDQFTAKLFTRQLVAPVFKRAFGELHDVAFVHQGHRVTIVSNCVFDRCTNQTFGAFFRTRLNTDTAMFREANFLHAHLFTQEFNHFLGVGRVSFPFDTRINVFRVFTEDNHIGQFRVFNRAWSALIVTYRTQADVEIQFLAQGNVQRANTATNRSGQRTFNGNAIFTNQIKGFSRQPDILTINLCGFFTGVNFHPGDFTLAFIGFLDCSVDHFQHGWGYIYTDSITFNVRDNRIFRNVEFAVLQGDLLALCRNNYFTFHSPLLRALLVCSSATTLHMRLRPAIRML